MKGFNFKEEDKEFIKENWEVLEVSEIKKKIGCRYNELVDMALFLGFKEPKPKKWTDEDVAKLTKLSETLCYEDIANELDRRPNAIYRKAKKLGIKLIQEHRVWTKEEDIYLKESWGNLKIETIAKKLRRTVNSINVRARRMHLGPMINNVNVILFPQICELFGITYGVVRDTWVKYGLKVKKISVSDNKTYKGVFLDDLMDFLEKNQDIWDSKKLELNILGKEPTWLTEKRKKDLDKDYKQYRVWTLEEKGIAKFLIKQGKSYEFIAQKVNRTEYAVATFLRSEGYSYLTSFHWKSNEIKFIRENLDKLSVDEMAHELGKRKESVKYIIEKIAYKFMVYEYHVWTNSEDEYLKKYYNKRPNYELANHLMVCKEVLIERLNELGIYRTLDHNWSDEEDDFLLQNYNKMSYKSLAEYFSVSKYRLLLHLDELGLIKHVNKDINEKRKELLRVLKNLLEDKEKEQGFNRVLKK